MMSSTSTSSKQVLSTTVVYLVLTTFFWASRCAPIENTLDSTSIIYAKSVMSEDATGSYSLCKISELE